MNSPAPVQIFGNASAAASTAATATVHGGNVLYAAIAAPNPPGISDTLGLVWSQLPGGVLAMTLWTATVPVGGGGADTITATGGGSHTALIVIEIEGAQASPIIASSTFNGATTTAITSNATAAAAPGSLVLGFIASAESPISATAFSPALASYPGLPISGFADGAYGAVVGVATLTAAVGEAFVATGNTANLWVAWCLILQGTGTPTTSPPPQPSLRGAYTRLTQVLGRIFRFTPPAPPAQVPTPPPLPGIRVVSVTQPRAVVPATRSQQLSSHVAAPSRPQPRPIAAVTVKGPVPPGRVRSTSALAQLRANPRAFLVQLVKGPRPPGAVVELRQRLAPLIPSPRAILRALVRGPVPPGAVRRVTQRLAPLIAPPRAILRVLVKGPIPPGGVRRVTQQLAALRPNPRALLTRLVKGPIPPGRALQLLQKLAPLRPLPRPLQALIDRNQPHAFTGRVLRVLQKLAPAPPPAAPGRPIEAALDRNEPHAFTGRIIEVRPHVAPLIPAPRALLVVVDRQEPKPFAGKAVRVVPHLAPFIIIPGGPPIRTRLDVQPYKVPLAGGMVIVVRPHVAPLSTFRLAPLRTGTQRYPGRHNIITWPAPPPQPVEIR
ncbi:MAG TPA: hypothetical protein VMU89_14725 [Thermomicrobiaceae bacterium]|nr:hypothetical protein [Thermomicrobiaceae bacterium]